MIYLICSILIFQSVKDCSEINSNTELFVLKITFEKGFSEDEISISIENKEIWKGNHITTNRSTQFTGDLVEIKRVGDKLIVNNNSQILEFEGFKDTDPQNLRISFKINSKGRVHKKKVDLSKGNHLGVNRSVLGCIWLNQYDYEFRYM
jgi:hypothetical protein